MSEKTSLIEFPCDFSLKIIGLASDHFLDEVNQIIKKHYPDTAPSQIQHKHSQHDKYMAITATVRAENQASLDALYRELTQLTDIKMVL